MYSFFPSGCGCIMYTRLACKLDSNAAITLYIAPTSFFVFAFLSLKLFSSSFMRKFSLFSKNFHITPARPKAKGETKDVITNDQKLSILPTVYSKSKQEWYVMRYTVEKCWQVMLLRYSYISVLLI